MKVKTKDFRAALDKVAHLATRRTSLPALNCVQLQSVSKTLQVITTDMECFALSKCECDGTLEPVCVSPKLLTGLLSGDDVELSITNGAFKVKSQGSAILSTVPADEFPEWPSSDGAKALGVNCSDLADAIESVAWLADNKQEARPQCGAVYIHCSPKSITAITTDGHGMSYFNRPAIAVEGELLVNCENYKILVDALRHDGAIIKTTDKWVMVESDTFSVAVRRMQCQPFSFDKIINAPRTLIGLIDAKWLKSQLATITNLGTTLDWGCRTHLNFTGKTLQVEFIGKANSFDTEMPFKCKNPVSLMVNADWMKKLLDNTEGDELKMSVTDNHAVVVESGDVANYLQQLVPA